MSIMYDCLAIATTFQHIIVIAIPVLVAVVQVYIDA